MARKNFGALGAVSLIFVIIVSLISWVFSLKQELVYQRHEAYDRMDNLMYKWESEIKQQGCPITITNLPSGNYTKVGCSDWFAFVKIEGKNPFRSEVVAVHSFEKIPDHFMVVNQQNEGGRTTFGLPLNTSESGVSP
ncbi:MAG: hypothetical protein HYT35_00895 [Candidatus Staskawiczbacteria bacterium]|nr:hypothetical protein [Candidatus Staskawiczbacteria bacterium]